MQNGHVERFNGRLRDECINANWFRNLMGARTILSKGSQVRVLPHLPSSSFKVEFALCSVSDEASLLCQPGWNGIHHIATGVP
jgi:hypothetical protein